MDRRHRIRFTSFVGSNNQTNRHGPLLSTEPLFGPYSFHPHVPTLRDVSRTISLYALNRFFFFSLVCWIALSRFSRFGDGNEWNYACSTSPLTFSLLSIHPAYNSRRENLDTHTYSHTVRSFDCLSLSMPHTNDG